MSTQTAAPCKRHPGFQTSVSCGRCGDPVCPRCLVHAPVGVRCPDCGRAAPNPVFDVSGLVLLRAAAVGLPIALLGGGLVWLMLFAIRFIVPEITPEVARRPHRGGGAARRVRIPYRRSREPRRQPQARDETENPLMRLHVHRLHNRRDAHRRGLQPDHAHRRLGWILPGNQQILKIERETEQ